MRSCPTRSDGILVALPQSLAPIPSLWDQLRSIVFADVVFVTQKSLSVNPGLAQSFDGEKTDAEVGLLSDV